MNGLLTPEAIVTALDVHIIGQVEAKRAVAVMLRNRWRRQKLSPIAPDQDLARERDPGSRPG